jgi:hypothetical protein
MASLETGVRCDFALEQLSKLLLREPHILDDFFEERAADVAGMHGDCGENIAADRVGKIAVAAFCNRSSS